MCTLAGHAVVSDKGIWNLDSYWQALDWIGDRLHGTPVPHSGEVTFVRAGGGSPNDEGALRARDWMGTLPEQVRANGVGAAPA